MVLTPSTMLPLGTALPLEALRRDLTPVCGAPLESVLRAGQPLLVLFLCPHCPFVKHIEAEITRLATDPANPAALLAICSNSTLSHPQDGPQGMRRQAEACSWSFPYLADPQQSVARCFRAACTPDLFLFDGDHQLVYRGQLDPSRPGNGLPCDGRDLRAALAALAAGEPPLAEQTASIGCNIKWHPGREPDWARP
ncbi:MAG: thioredoxin family protein [Synechococcaceae cyanobacterium]|nr:thioredoxin family protein [Synechococcaceae cyanobacterium]